MTLSRKTPLRRTPFRRDPALAKHRPHRGLKPIPRKVRAAVKERSRSCCEACGLWVQSGHCHHRLLRSQGGQHTEANLVYLCRRCHDRAHANPDDARAHGLILRGWQNPAEVPVTMWELAA
jgi:5-methylcytosine-specific restriction endonuclease McrA